MTFAPWTKFPHSGTTTQELVDWLRDCAIAAHAPPQFIDALDRIEVPTDREQELQTKVDSLEDDLDAAEGDRSNLADALRAVLENEADAEGQAYDLLKELGL